MITIGFTDSALPPSARTPHQVTEVANRGVMSPAEPIREREARPSVATGPEHRKVRCLARTGNGLRGGSGLALAPGRGWSSPMASGHTGPSTHRRDPQWRPLGSQGSGIGMGSIRYPNHEADTSAAYFRAPWRVRFTNSHRDRSRSPTMKCPCQ